MRVICETCGTKFTKKISDFKRTQHHFCSSKCFGAYRTKYKLGSIKGKSTDRSQLKKIEMLARQRRIK